MSTYADFFKGKRITVLGLGLLGRGVGDVAFLAECGAKVLVTDKKSESELAESVEKLRDYPHVTFHLGGHDTKDFVDADMVIKAAGVSLDSPEIKAARDAGVAVYMSTALFAKFAAEAGAMIVGITGTRGKSTVAHMIHYVLARAGRRAHLGGNIRGVSTLALLPQIQKGDPSRQDGAEADIAVLELDSWQLQGFGDLEMSPHIAIFTSFMPDHQNYYPDMDTYFADKANIFRYQMAGNHLFVGSDVAKRIHDAHPPVAPRTAAPIPQEWRLRIPGAHNRAHAALAAAALHELGLSEAEIRDGLESFPGVEGRMQFVKDIGGIAIYNDNNATTPEATLAALGSFPPEKTVLIMGGADKGLSTDELITAAKRCKKVILLAGTGTDRIRSQFDTEVHDALKPAVEAALAAASAGDIVLFSPAFASFGMFKNEYDRNDQFLRVVASL
ncbi:MAG TPA: UDP-N-acetylmuramoyl-L-alanine--D-glutamate ligase [Candidatus Paceibacterota bacterium]|nr:UDP-N-acetylmuramoyl-L-alanine--D-glutamate ligase [Candidatus Paceibacterota bacterium]